MAKTLRMHTHVIPGRYLPRTYRTKVQRSRAAHYIYLPKRIRECCSLAAGDKVQFRLTDGGFIVEKVHNVTIGEGFQLA